MLGTLLVILSSLISIAGTQSSQLDIYECGFDSFGDSRERYDIRFYIIALLFLLFDIEIAYLFPLAIILDFTSYFYALIFITLLTAGYIYEWRFGVLNFI